MKNVNKGRAMPMQLSFDFYTENPITHSRQAPIDIGPESKPDDVDAVLSWLAGELYVGVYHSRKTVEDIGGPILGLPRSQIRKCLSHLISEQKVRDDKRRIVKGEKRGRGGAFNYLNPVGFTGGFDK
jgi:hypothetical protein